jgi:hypothetical protein
MSCSTTENLVHYPSMLEKIQMTYWCGTGIELQSFVGLLGKMVLNR